MKSIDIPVNVNVRINHKLTRQSHRIGNFTVSAKRGTPIFVMLLYATMKLLIVAVKHLIK